MIQDVIMRKKHGLGQGPSDLSDQISASEKRREFNGPRLFQKS